MGSGQNRVKSGKAAMFLPSTVQIVKYFGEIDKRKLRRRI
jgi:hypothetical protein